MWGGSWLSWGFGCGDSTSAGEAGFSWRGDYLNRAVEMVQSSWSGGFRCTGHRTACSPWGNRAELVFWRLGELAPGMRVFGDAGLSWCFSVVGALGVSGGGVGAVLLSEKHFG